MAKKFKRINRDRPYLNILDFLVKERTFLGIIMVGIIVAGISTGYGRAAMWVGFFFAAYATVANDSIQSLGTFIESNKARKWWILWLFVGSIFLVTVTWSFLHYDGDVTYQRLLNPDGTSDYPHPEKFSFFQIIAPLVLLILTRMRMPVSTTFLILSVFSADTSGITSVVGKSLSGYVMAFVLSFAVWYLSYNAIRKFFKSRKAHTGWMAVQWIVSGSLWAVWVMQDGANIAVFLPRHQSLFQFIIFAVTIFLGLGLLFYLRGDRIQEVVSEKSRISDIRAATLVDLTYVLLLIYKLFISTVPMSTTWVFLGVIGGREIAISLARKKKGKKHRKKAFKLIARDFIYAFLGLIISVALAAAANKSIRDAIFASISV
ncbi:MAG: hypothetical protein CMP12_16910 [Zunongwangia sp.]|jgi:hypothetical protein|uniref:Membrane protein n=2 Tax=Zunongwangia profunda TaxID=398743 RepID=D5BH20_ZUNPS|nr:hypothetical protein [Zunongwangia profunda]MAC66102.1 hypothetical protein [Flavobacteriaceae bacterium]MAO37553.1 hypothetical protein [Zunongwangia sp.]ADF51194.1 membrane protein [Zunongwangia profunda SM-A87]MAS72986.1 hypothetical protein [Zunongwangia sp.]MCC4229774.1 hypothetical protein [Zunongwangia profunda]|tara:strand:+ start:5491 stop:6615 length:1125 start_codon:yes stop_codon:yes gene_type:complete